MAKAVGSLGELEIRVLRLVWEHQPCSERNISDLVQQQHAVARTTVLKTLQRLEAKGFLARVPGQTPIHFRATLDEQRLLPVLTGRFVERVLGGCPGPLLAYFADSGRLSQKDLKSLQAMAKKIAQPRATK